MKHLVFFLEEISAKVMLEGLLPRILPQQVIYKCIPFEGKQDLQKQLEKRLRGWQQPNTAFIVLQDQDSSDCTKVKKKLQTKANAAGRPNTVIRVACTELESWYFGDLAAVEAGLNVANLQRHSKKSKYLIPDQIVHPSVELEKITGYTYQKVSGSRAIGKHIDPSRNTSHSFRVFLAGVQRALQSIPYPK